MPNDTYHRISATERTDQARAAVLGCIAEHTAAHPILSADITRQTGVSGVVIRAVVSVARREGQPIASGDRGYYMAQCAAELQGTIDHITGRYNALGAVLDGLRAAQSQVLRVEEIDLSVIYAGDGGE